MSSGTLVFPAEDDAMAGNSLIQPGLPPLPVLGNLETEEEEREIEMLHSFT